MMKILQICNKMPFPPKDGGAIATLAFTTGAKQAGHEVTLLAMNTVKHPVSEDKIKLFEQQTRIKVFAVPVDNSIKLIQAFINLFSKKSYNIVRFASKKFENKLVSILKNEKFDLVQFDGLHITFYLETVRQYSDAKIVYRSHNVEYKIWEHISNNSSGLKKWYLNILTKRLFRFEINQLNKFDAVVPITENDASLIRQLGCKIPIKVCPAGINIENYQPDFSILEFPSLFHLGGLDWMPNQEGIIWFLKNVWNKIHKTFPQLKFYIAGRNMPLWMQKLQFQNVIMIGEVEDSKKFMNSKAIMIVPLLSGSGMRIKIIEGMALGKTIISTTIGAEGILYEHEKNIFIANEPDEFVNAVRKCVDNKYFAEKIGFNGIKLVKEYYDNKKIVSELVNYYKNNLC